MIESYEKFRLPDENKDKEIILEVNWNLKDEKVKDCKLIRFIFPNGDTAVVKKEHLLAILFALGDRAEQMKMIPQKISTSRWYETVVSVKAKKNIRAGEEITFPIKLSLPTFSQEVIAEAKRDVLEGKVGKNFMG